MSWRTAGVSALGAAVFAAITTWVGVVSGAPPQFLVADLVGGATFLVTGLAATRLRPASPAGPALIACTVLWFVGSYAPTGQPVVTHLGFAFERTYDLVLAALLLHLAGGIRGWGRLALVGLGAGMTLRTAGRLFLQDPARSAEPCEGCPANPLALWPDDQLFIASEVLTNSAVAVAAVVVGLIAVARLVGSTPVARRVRGPVLVAGVIATGATALHALEYAWATVTGQLLIDLPEPWAERFSWTIFGLRLLVPVAFLVATLRARGEVSALVPLAVDLGGLTAGSTLDEALRRALGDPSALLVRRSAAGAWVTHDGTRVDPRTPGPGRIATPVGTDAGDSPVAFLLHDPALADHPELLGGVVRVLALSLERDRLEASLRASAPSVVAAQAEVAAAGPSARRDIEELLDAGPQPRLQAALDALERARVTDAASGSDQLGAQIDAAITEMETAIGELRSVVRGETLRGAEQPPPPGSA